MGQEVDKGEKEDVQEVSKEDNALERMGKNSNAELEMCTMEGNEGRQGHNPEAPGAEIVNEEIRYEGSDLIMNESKAIKGWKRIQRKGKGDGKGEQAGSGSKRKGNEVPGGVLMETEVVVKKQKGEECDTTMENSHVDTENNVAGPTPWTLGCQ